MYSQDMSKRERGGDINSILNAFWLSFLSLTYHDYNRFSLFLDNRWYGKRFLRISKK